MTELRRQTHTTVEHRWEWVERFGPQLGDERKWAVSTSGNNIHLTQSSGRGQTRLTIPASGAQNLINALTEALATTVTESPATAP